MSEGTRVRVQVEVSETFYLNKKYSINHIPSIADNRCFSTCQKKEIKIKNNQECNSYKSHWNPQHIVIGTHQNLINDHGLTLDFFYLSTLISPVS